MEHTDREGGDSKGGWRGETGGWTDAVFDFVEVFGGDAEQSERSPGATRNEKGDGEKGCGGGGGGVNVVETPREGDQEVQGGVDERATGVHIVGTPRENDGEGEGGVGKRAMDVHIVETPQGQDKEKQGGVGERAAFPRCVG